MTWTPETLARAFHEAYRAVSPKFYGTTAQAPAWDEINEGSREHLVAVCREVLGEPQILPTATDHEVMKEHLEAVPSSGEFERAKETAPQDEQGEDALSDWEADLRRQIDAVAAPSIRRAFEGVKEPFRK